MDELYGSMSNEELAGRLSDLVRGLDDRDLLDEDNFNMVTEVTLRVGRGNGNVTVTNTSASGDIIARAGVPFGRP